MATKMRKAWLRINELFCKEQVQYDRVSDEILRWAEDKAELRDRNQFEQIEDRLDHEAKKKRKRR